MATARMLHIDKLFRQISLENNYDNSSEGLLKIIERNGMTSKTNKVAEATGYIIENLLQGLSRKGTRIQSRSYALLSVLLKHFPSLSPFIFGQIQISISNESSKQKTKNSDVIELSYDNGPILAFCALIRSNSFESCERNDLEQFFVKLLKNYEDCTMFNPVAAHLIFELYFKIKPIVGNSIDIFDFYTNYVIGHVRKSHTGKDIVALFNIVKVILPHLQSEKEVEVVLCPFVVQALMNSSFSNNEGMTKSVNELNQQILYKLSVHKANECYMQIAVLHCLINYPGSVRYDWVTGTTLLKNATDILTKKNVMKLVSELIALCQKESEIVESSALVTKLSKEEIVQAINWINHLLIHKSVNDTKCIEWKAMEIAVVHKFIFFNDEFFKKIQMNRQPLITSYTRVFNQPMKTLDEELYFIYLIVNEISKLLNQSTENCSFGGKARKMWTRTMDRLKELKCEKNSSGKQEVLKLLYGHLSLQLFISPQDAIRMLNQTFAITFDSKHKPSDYSKWVESIIELILDFLSKEERFWRRISVIIFGKICHTMKPESVNLITDIFVIEKEDLFDLAIDQEEIQQDSSEEEESDDDEDIDIEEEEDDDDEDDDDDDYDDDDDDDDDDEDAGDDEISNEKKLQLINLQMKMQSCLMTNMDDVDLDSVPEEEFERIDKMLAPLMQAYSKIKKNKKKDKKIKTKKEDKSIIQFKLRVCELLISLVEEAPSLSHLLAVISPLLLSLQRMTKKILKEEKELANSMRSTLDKISKVKAVKTTGDVCSIDLVKQLDIVIDIASKCNSDPVICKLIKSIISFLFHHGVNLGDNSEHSVLNAYLRHLKALMLKTVCPIPPEVLKGPLSLVSEGLISVASCLVQHIFLENVKLNRKMLAIHFLQTIYSNNEALKQMPSKKMIELNEIISIHLPKLFDYAHLKVPNEKILLDLLDLLIAIHFNQAKNISPLSFDWNGIMEYFKDLYSRVRLPKRLESKIRLLAIHRTVQLPSPPKKNGKCEAADKKRKLENESEAKHSKKQKTQRENKPHKSEAKHSKKQKTQRENKPHKRMKNKQRIKHNMNMAHSGAKLQGFTFKESIDVEEEI